MNILAMLARLEGALGRTNLARQMILIPPKPVIRSNSLEDLNFVVGYDGSPRSQSALDLTLWIAHQTRLATHRQVTVQVVYVVDLENACEHSPFRQTSIMDVVNDIVSTRRAVGGSREVLTQSRSGGAIAELPAPPEQSCRFDQFEQADRILWQARNLAEEWRGSLETHLRFGDVATELRTVVEAESASLLLLGCESPESSLVQSLGIDFPCPVLGIPSAL